MKYCGSLIFFCLHILLRLYCLYLRLLSVYDKLVYVNRTQIYCSMGRSIAQQTCFCCFQLQDTETTSGESEVKFQVSRDTLGAMLRSMAYIREQLSSDVSFSISFLEGSLFELPKLQDRKLLNAVLILMFKVDMMLQLFIKHVIMRLLFASK